MAVAGVNVSEGGAGATRVYTAAAPVPATHFLLGRNGRFAHPSTNRVTCQNKL